MSSKRIIIINGPNLNLLGEREPEVYGTETLKDLEKLAKEHIKSSNLNIDIVFFQSNSEGDIVNSIQDANTFQFFHETACAPQNIGSYTINVSPPPEPIYAIMMGANNINNIVAENAGLYYNNTICQGTTSSTFFIQCPTNPNWDLEQVILMLSEQIIKTDDSDE